MTDTLPRDDVEPEPVAPGAAPRRRTDRARSEAARRVQSAVRWVTAGVLGGLVIVSAIGGELRVQDADPMFMRVVIERVHAFGGSYYENAIHNKGPLEPFIYSTARHIGGYNGFWLVISIFMTMAALVLAWAAAKTARFTGGNRDVALAAAAAVFVHMTVSNADYAGVLYARNMTVCLLALAFVTVFEDRGWRTPRSRIISAALIGTALGIAVQTLTPEIFAGAAIALGALALMRHRVEADEYVRLRLVFLGSGAAAFFSALVYYAARGSFTEFWSGWWEHARYMNIGTGRSLGAQFALGWDSFYGYYQDRPLALLVVFAFAFLTASIWSTANHRTRVLHAVLLGWFAGAWIELVLSQRYSSHYFSVTTAPTALMGGALAGYAYHAYRNAVRDRARTFWWPLAAVVLSIWLSGTAGFVDAVKRTSRFTSVDALALDIERNQGGAERTVRGVLDLVSDDGDPLLAWTNDSYAYLNFRRVSATRFIWKSFLLGEVYLGRTSTDYVLPETWTWFREDLEESKPVAFFQYLDPPAPGSPFEATVRDDFSVVYQDDKQSVFLRNDVARDVLDTRATDRWRVPDGATTATGWDVDGDTLRYEASGGTADTTTIATGDCYRIDGTIDTDENVLPGAVFSLNDPSGEQEELRLTFDGETAASGSAVVEYYRTPTGLDATERGPVPFSFVVGKRAAVLIVDGKIQSALRTSAPGANLLLTARQSSLTVDNLRTGPPPALSGC